MIKVQLKHSMNANSIPKRKEIVTGKSLTVPNDSMSIKEIITRSERGLPITGAKVALYEGDEDLFNGRDPRTLDYAEIQQMKEETQNVLNKYKEKQIQLSRIDRDEFEKWKKDQKTIKDKKVSDVVEDEKEYPKKTVSPGGGRKGEKDI